MSKAASRGFTLFLTGLSGAGESTISERVATKMRRDFGREATILDGDIVREMLSSGLP